jgi:hypothetical protein
VVCYYHRDIPAIGICKHCHRGLCIDCAALVNDSLACKDRHENQVAELNLLAERGVSQAKRVGSGYMRNAVFYSLVGVLFTGFGIYQYRFLGLQAIFFILTGLFLLYAAVTNFIEARKYN